MRRLTISFVIATFALSLSAQDLDKILNDHYKASAQDKVSQINTVTMTGKLVAMGMESGLTMYQARPSNFRMEMAIMGSDMVTVFNGNTGWVYAPAMGITQPQEMGDEEIKNAISQANIDSPLWDYEAKGNKLELAGMSDDGSAYKVKLTTAEGTEMFICIGKESHLLTKILTNQVVNGMDSEIELEFKDYKNVKGIPTAHYMATKMGGQAVSTITFESIEYNTDLDPALFEKPAVE